MKKEKVSEKNIVEIGLKEEVLEFLLEADELNMIKYDKVEPGFAGKAKIRYNQKEEPATVEQIGKDKLHIEFDFPQRAVTKGQAVVLYDNDIVVGGGTII